MIKIPYSLLTFLLLALCVSVLSSCSDDDDEGQEHENEEEVITTACNDTLTPIVMMHGFLGAGDTYTKQFMRFTANNYCGDRLFVFDWNSLDQEAEHTADLDEFIDNILSKTGASQINLAGHSAGGGLGYSYLEDSTHATKVANYVHIGSFYQLAPAGPNGSVPTLNLWSEADLVIEDRNDIPGAVNVKMTDADHYEVATNVEAFEAMYQFFNNDLSPETTDIITEAEPEIGGRVLTFGENQPLPMASIKIYALDSIGFRVNEQPDANLTADEQGNWGPWTAQPNVSYEFEVKGVAETDRLVYYVREGFTRSNPLVYLRTLPPPTSLAGILLASIPQEDNQTALIIFSSSQAVSSMRDNLTINGFELSSDTYASPEQTSIAFFLYDDGNDGETTYAVPTLFAAFPFLSGADIFFPTDPPGSISIEFNDRRLNARNWRSKSDGPVVVVLD